jgi:hypothetical protein
MADYVSPEARRRIATGLMAAQYAENPPTAPMGYDFDAAPLSPGLMNFAAQRGQPGVIQKTLGLIPGFDQDGKRGAQSWGNALMSTAQFPIDAVAGMGQALTAPARAYRGEFDPVSEEGVGEALNVAGNAMMGGLAAPKPRGVVGSAGGDLKGAALGAIPDTPGIRAYHGSPHDFDKFDLSKIGSGEGAQAYGHGLYFAENEGVAKSYRDGLTQVDGYQGTAADLIRHHSGDRVAALNEAKRGIDKYAATDPPTSREWQKVAGVLSDETYSGPGRMYEVNIKANPDDFLDWDKRLGEQSANVRDKVKSLMLASREIPADPEGAYKQAIERYNAGPKATAVTDDPGVIQAYDAMRLARQGDKAFDRQKIGALLQESGRWSPEDARRTFLDAGIPGVKYLDRGSRTAGDGTSNYVVFDDKLIEILRKYGLLGMAGGAAAAEYGGNSLMPSRPASPQYRPGDA